MHIMVITFEIPGSTKDFILFGSCGALLQEISGAQTLCMFCHRDNNTKADMKVVCSYIK